jgi:hypothetical protein
VPITGDWLYALRGTYNTSYEVSVPRRAMRRVSGGNTITSLDPTGQQTHPLVRDRQGIHLVVSRHRVYACDHNGFIFYSDDKGSTWTFFMAGDALSEGSMNSYLCPHAVKDDVNLPWGTLYTSDIRGNIRHITPQGTVTLIRSGNGQTVSGTGYYPGPPVVMNPQGTHVFTSTVDSMGSCDVIAAPLPLTTGSVWTTLAGYTASGIMTTMSFSPADPNRGFFFGLNYQSWFTVNGGTAAYSWTSFSENTGEPSYTNWVDSHALSTGCLVLGHEVSTGISTLKLHDWVTRVATRFQLPGAMLHARKLRVISNSVWYVIAGDNTPTSNAALTLWRTEDAGVNWQAIDPGTTESVYDLVQLSTIQTAPPPAQNLTFAGNWSNGYFDQVDACASGTPSTAVYSATGSSSVGTRMYWDQAGQQALAAAYYKDAGSWYQTDATGTVTQTGVCQGGQV